MAVAILLATATVSCSSRPVGPYSLAFARDGASPRVLETSHEVAVPLTLTNAGQRAWDPARVHLSYHWLWLVPRELATRSRWDVPYHDGIRTELAGLVPPGGRLAVHARVLAPTWPGLYWLQWDMVEEDVTWFAQVSPRQGRALVVVLPPLAWLLAPLPLLVALCGIVAVRLTTSAKATVVRRSLWRRRKADPTYVADPSYDADPAYVGSGFSRTVTRTSRRFFQSIPDVIWCATALAVKPLVVVHDALLEPTRAAYWLIAAAALVPPLVALFVLPRPVRAWLLVAIGIVGSLVILGDVAYYRFFGDVLSAPALLGIGQTGRVWGSIRTLFAPSFVWLVLDWPFAIVLAVMLSRRQHPNLSRSDRLMTAAIAATLLAAVGLAMSVPRALMPLSQGPLTQMFRDRAVMEQLGPFGFHGYDAWNYARSTWFRRPAGDDEVAGALAWFVARRSLRAASSSPPCGAARNRNVIVVQVESLQDFAVDYRVAGQDVMPHLRAWQQTALRFTNVTDQTSEGRTSDAEFTTMTSLLPLDHGAVAFRFPGNHYAALPRVLGEHQYASVSAVPFEPGFWNRQVMHPSYGFERSLFEADFRMTDQIGWGLNDREFLQQMVPRLEQLRQPFLAWVITLSLHHPFDDFPARHKLLKLGPMDGTSFGNYLHAMRFFDEALHDFVTSLARVGLLDTSLLVVFGDHDAGFPRTPALARQIGIPEDEAAWALNDRVPLFIRLPAAPNDPPIAGVHTSAAGQTDLAPTLLCLLGIDAAGLPYAGRNLLAANADGPVPRPYGDWLDAHHLFLAGAGPECLDRAGKLRDVRECEPADAEARRARDISRLVVTGDLQERLRTMMTTDVPSALNR